MGRALFVPILLMAIGTGWLLSVLGIAPDINWVWTLGLGAVGLLCFVIYGFDKATLVLGGFFIIASALSVLRQTGRLSINVEIPILVIVSGALMLVAKHPAVPIPAWLKEMT